MATDVMARVKKHYDSAVRRYGEEAVLGVFLYGSWNYNTNTSDSDVDTKCILIPNIYHLAIKPYEVKHLHVWPDSEEKDFEVCECMSIMHMAANWKKQNINFLEIMFTPYCIINPLYKDFWEKRFSMEDREKVARYDLRQAIHSMAHQALHTIQQNPEDPKKHMNAMRISYTLARILDTDMPYWECLQQQEVVKSLRFKAPDPVVTQDLIQVFNYYLDHLDDYIGKGSWKPGVDHILERLILEAIQVREKSFFY